MNKIKGLDGLRGLSVLMVIMSHGVLWPYIGIANKGFLSIVSGTTGVNIFFSLSGFLITMLLIAEKKETGEINLKGFFMRRFLRIFPLYFLAITFLFVLNNNGYSQIEECGFFYAYTYMMNFAPIICNSATLSHFWSLSVEEHFYLIWPVIFMLNARAALYGAIFFTAACLYFGASLFVDLYSKYSIGAWTFPAAVPIAYGCITAFIYDNKIIKRVFTDNRTSLSLLVAALLGMASPAYLEGKIIWLTSVSILMLYIFYNQKSFFVRVLEFKPLVLIGLISYGLYVWQGVFTGNGPYRIAGVMFPPDISTGLLITVFIAPLSYIFFEAPIMRLKRYFSWRNKKINPKDNNIAHST